MNVRHVLVGFLLVGLNTAAFACDLPTLVAIPPVAALHYGKFDTIAGTVGAFGALGEAAPVTSRTTRLCSNDFIEPYAFETTAVRSRQCALGRFFDLNVGQVLRLMQLREAARPPAGSESVAPEAEAEETPAPPRSER